VAGTHNIKQGVCGKNRSWGVPGRRKDMYSNVSFREDGCHVTGSLKRERWCTTAKEEAHKSLLTEKYPSSVFQVGNR
jgi:hypothetical protein